MVCRLAMGTGFRRDELRSLQPESFRLDSRPPTVTVTRAYAKDGRHAEQPISETLATALRPYLATKPFGRPVFATLPPTRTAAMLRHDLAAGIEYDTPSEVCGFHSLRGIYISNLVASVKTCQVLARHSTPSLKIGVYARASVHDLTGAVESLPDLNNGPAPKRADVRGAGSGRNGRWQCPGRAGEAPRGRNRWGTDVHRHE
jgi:integrase